jgi:hypothetical protein
MIEPDADSLIKWDENNPTDFGFAQSLFDFYNRPCQNDSMHPDKSHPGKLAKKATASSLAERQPYLKEFDNSLHLFISADTSFRIQHIKALLPDQSEHKIKEQIRTIDKQRKKFFQVLHRQTFAMPKTTMCA